MQLLQVGLLHVGQVFVNVCILHK